MRSPVLNFQYCNSEQLKLSLPSLRTVLIFAIESDVFVRPLLEKKLFILSVWEKDFFTFMRSPFSSLLSIEL